MSTDTTPVGGGVKKILYALKTINRIGLLDSKKALTTNNTCKACGLGMGGLQQKYSSAIYRYSSTHSR